MDKFFGDALVALLMDVLGFLLVNMINLRGVLRPPLNGCLRGYGGGAGHQIPISSSWIDVRPPSPLPNYVSGASC